jgi:hypothetical protein
MARPRKTEPRDQHIAFRLTLVEAIAVSERATRAGQSLSDYARQATLAHRPRRREATFALEPATFRQIRMLGVNLNQIAKRLNAQDLPAPPELAPLLAAIQALLERALRP